MTKGNSEQTIEARITFLEMADPRVFNFPVPTKPSLALMKAENIPAQFYAYLYEAVGKDCHWEERRDLDPASLNTIINDDVTDIRILYADGCPAGFFELELSNLPEQAELLYFGLTPNYRGLGLAKWFLSAAISAAWSHKPAKLSLQTNTLDHPAALSLYQKLGFAPVATGTAKIKPWN